MRAALIHGILLAVMLVYGYRTWTRDKTVKPDLGKVVLWDKAEADLVSIELKTERKTVRLEQRTDASGAYWWGTETTIEKKPKPVDPNAGSGSAGSAAAGSGSAGSGSAGSGSAGSGSAGSGSAGSGSAGSGSGSAAKPATPPTEMVETQKVREFPLGDAGSKLLKNYFAARALRDLGKPNDTAKKDYKLADAKNVLTVTFKDGKRAFLVGGSVYGGGDRYVVDQASGNAYVLSKDLVANLETGESSLQLVDPKGVDAKLVEGATIEAYGKTKEAARVTAAGTEGQATKTWGDAATKKGNQTIANFIDNTNNLKPTEYLAKLKPEQLTPVFKITYKDARNAPLGTLVLFKAETTAKTAEDADLDPTAPGKTEVQYYILTEKTRVPALVRKDTAQRAEQDLPLVFSDKPPPVDVKGTPFANPPGGAGGPPPSGPAGLPQKLPATGDDNPWKRPSAGSAAPAGSAAKPSGHDSHAH